MKTLLTLLLFFGYTTSYAQDDLSLDTLMSLANCRDHTCFYQKARKMGFTFSTTSENEEGIEYAFRKPYVNGSHQGEMNLTFLILKDTYTNKIVTFVTEEDIIKRFEPLLEEKEFNETDCDNPFVPKNGIGFCYQNDDYDLILTDESIVLADGSRTNSYRVIIALK